MKARVIVVSAVVAAVLAAQLHASGQAGIYAIVERVVFEPNDRAPERVQVWGAFALIERMPADFHTPGDTHLPGQTFTNYLFSGPSRGYLYFKLPDAAADIANAKREWADLASVAGTGQAVAFGYWDRTRGDKIMRIREATAKPEDPDVYLTDVGVAKLPAAGSHAGIVEALLKLVKS